MLFLRGLSLRLYAVSISLNLIYMSVLLVRGNKLYSSYAIRYTC